MKDDRPKFPENLDPKDVSSDDDETLTPQQYHEQLEEQLDILADLLALPGLSARDRRLLDGLHSEIAVEACACQPPLSPEEQAEEDAAVAQMMDWVEELMRTGRRPRPAMILVGGSDSVAPMNRLQELLARRELRRGRDDAELDELGRLLAAYRRTPGPWKRCEIEGRTAYLRELDCGHDEMVFSNSEPRGGTHVVPDGTERELPLSAVCHACYRNRGNA